MSGSKLTVKFNSSLLAGGKVEVKDYNKSNTKAFRVRERSHRKVAVLLRLVE